MANSIILHVEDNADHAALVRRCLRSVNDCELVHHSDGEQALDYLEALAQEGHPPPRLVLLDLRLPRVDGFEVLERLKKDPRWRRVPVVVLTTSAADRDISRALELHANSYLAKPSDYDAFKQLLTLVRTYWLDVHRTVAAPV